MPTLADSIWVNRFPTPSKTLYTIYSLRPEGYSGPLFEAPVSPDSHYVSLWHHEELTPVKIGDRMMVPAAAERARSVREQAQRRADDATAYTVEQREELEAALGSCRRSDAEVVNAQAVHQQVERWNATQARLRDLQQAVDRARTALAEHQEIPTPPTTDDPELNADLDQARERIAEATESVRNARQAHAEAVARRERHARWRSDLAARAAAEEKVQGAKALFAELRRIETDVAGRGADELLGAAFFYTPPNFGSPAVRAGVIGLDDGRDFWSGPGLSAAQRLILATAIDRALDQIMGRRLRLALLEADPLDAGVIDHLLAALEGDVSGGALDNAIVITCHRPHVPAGWKVISTSGSAVKRGRSVRTPFHISSCGTARSGAVSARALSGKGGIPTGAITRRSTSGRAASREVCPSTNRPNPGLAALG